MTKREFQLFDRVRVRTRPLLGHEGVVSWVASDDADEFLLTEKIYVHFPPDIAGWFHAEDLEHADDEA